MKTFGNTMLITGGGSGIGRGLAEAFHRLGNQVVIAGRRRSVLKEVTKANAGMNAIELDVADPNAIRQFADQVMARFPSLDFLIHNAGMMKLEQLRDGGSALSDAEETVVTNLLGPIRLNMALLPFLLKKTQATIMTVSSGLAFVPRASAPTYCATKAAIHSYSQSLRYQLRDTKIQVVELAPPYVQTELTGQHQATDPRAMPLNDFIVEVMSIIQTTPNATEICVERVKPQRLAERSGDYDAFFKKFNDLLSASQPGSK